MGDMAEDFAMLKEYNRERRESNYQWAERVFAGESGFIRHTDWHWATILCGDKLDYWPSSSRWRWRNKTSRGTPKDLQRFMLNRQREEDEDNAYKSQ
ncbi:hypothetical protein LCGC14_1239640 [marine sediment metagenome]|uniref:Uncharacterized protein n=1 Tax=marine sediment metagenome TaxID=412755 RepID=A0A0F9NNF6_9ZZZZ